MAIQNPETLRLLTPMIAMGINVLGQVMSKRLIFRHVAILKSEAFGFALGICMVGAVNWDQWATCCFEPSELWAGLLSDALLYVLLSYCFFHFVNLSVTARRIRLLRDLALAGQEGMTREALLESYGPREILGIRLLRLVGSGQIVEREGRYYGGRRFPVFWIARAIVLMKLLVMGKRSEFQ